MAIEFETRPQIPSVEIQYLNLLNHIYNNGLDSSDRTGVGTRKVFGETLKADLQSGFPLLTTKEIKFESIKTELLWFINGERNIRPLVLKGVNIWNDWPLKRYLQENGLEHISKLKTPDLWSEEMKKFKVSIREDVEFASKWGDLGPVYGYQWRHWKNPDGTETDQLANAIELIKTNPDSRRIIVTAWNPSDINEMAISGLPPCHMQFQFQVEGNKLNLAMYQRSVDSFLGLPYNIASYALLNNIVANITNKVPGILTLFLADTHIYLNHQEQIKTQLERSPLPMPQLSITKKLESIDYIPNDCINLKNYTYHSAIFAPIAV